jgi:ketosteroid isomerase-like protein
MPRSEEATNIMRLFRNSILVVGLALLCLARTGYAASDKDRSAIEKTGEAIRAAFAQGDVATAMEYHHPDVVKALGFHKQLKGRDAVAADLRGTLRQFNLEFVMNQVESLLIEGNTAVEQTLFAIKGTPKTGGEPFLFKGRTMVVYIRYEKSPTGWASIREMIQPATD